MFGQVLKHLLISIFDFSSPKFFFREQKYGSWPIFSHIGTQWTTPYPGYVMDSLFGVGNINVDCVVFLFSGSLRRIECSKRSENIINQENTIFYIEAIPPKNISTPTIFFELVKNISPVMGGF